jgi:hypothetical protein
MTDYLSLTKQNNISTSYYVVHSIKIIPDKVEKSFPDSTWVI